MSTTTADSPTTIVIEAPSADAPTTPRPARISMKVIRRVGSRRDAISDIANRHGQHVTVREAHKLLLAAGFRCSRGTCHRDMKALNVGTRL